MLWLELAIVNILMQFCLFWFLFNGQNVMIRFVFLFCGKSVVIRLLARRLLFILDKIFVSLSWVLLRLL